MVDQVPIVKINFGLFIISSDHPVGFFLFVVAYIGLYLAAAYILDTPFGRLLIAMRKRMSGEFRFWDTAWPHPPG